MMVCPARLGSPGLPVANLQVYRQLMNSEALPQTNKESGVVESILKFDSLSQISGIDWIARLCLRPLVAAMVRESIMTRDTFGISQR